jgi:hypothetical protein
MPERDFPNQKKQEKGEQTRRIQGLNSKPLSQQMMVRDNSTNLIGDTPFYPPMLRHVQLLSRASPEQRELITRQLQETYGNRYVQRLFKSTTVQAKLTVGAADDPYEHEADRVAEQVMSVTTPPHKQAVVQREIPNEEKELQTKLDIKNYQLQRQQATAQPAQQPAVQPAQQPAAQSALTDYAGTNFTGAVRCDTQAVNMMQTIDTYAGNHNVQLVITDSFRQLGQAVQNPIVPPANVGNHHAGHAIDMNIRHNNILYNSSTLNPNNFNNLPQEVRDFLTDIRNDPGLRWGGDFGQADPVHIDDGLNVNNPALFQQRVNAVQPAQQPAAQP